MPFPPAIVTKLWHNLPPPVREGLAHAVSIGTGLLAALMLYYVLYRVSLPSHPFIYVAF